MGQDLLSRKDQSEAIYDITNVQRLAVEWSLLKLKNIVVNIFINISWHTIKPLIKGTSNHKT